MFIRAIKLCAALFLGMVLCHPAEASAPHLTKVLPQLIDAKGRNSLSPSLYERDAYQFFLRNNPVETAGIQFEVLWRGASKGKNLKLRVEMRGVREDALRLEIIETPVQKKGWFRTWSSVVLRGNAYKNFGELSAWRVTLWDGDQQLSEQKSFLW